MKQITLVDLDSVLFEFQFGMGPMENLDSIEKRAYALEQILQIIERDPVRPETNPL